MKTFDYTVKDELGIHARPAGLLVKEAKNFTSKITIKKGEKEVDATSDGAWRKAGRDSDRQRGRRG